MDNRPVSYDNAFADRTAFIRRGMYDCPFLDRRFIADLDGAVVAPQDGPVADIAALADPHVAYDNCRFAHVRAGPDNGLFSVKPVEHSSPPPCRLCASLISHYEDL